MLEGVFVPFVRRCAVVDVEDMVRRKKQREREPVPFDSIDVPALPASTSVLPPPERVSYRSQQAHSSSSTRANSTSPLKQRMGRRGRSPLRFLRRKFTRSSSPVDQRGPHRFEGAENNPNLVDANGNPILLLKAPPPSNNNGRRNSNDRQLVSYTGGGHRSSRDGQLGLSVVSPLTQPSFYSHGESSEGGIVTNQAVVWDGSSHRIYSSAESEDQAKIVIYSRPSHSSQRGGNASSDQNSPVVTVSFPCDEKKEDGDESSGGRPKRTTLTIVPNQDETEIIFEHHRNRKGHPSKPKYTIHQVESRESEEGYGVSVFESAWQPSTGALPESATAATSPTTKSHNLSSSSSSMGHFHGTTRSHAGGGNNNKSLQHSYVSHGFDVSTTCSAASTSIALLEVDEQSRQKEKGDDSFAILHSNVEEEEEEEEEDEHKEEISEVNIDSLFLDDPSAITENLLHPDQSVDQPEASSRSFLPRLDDEEDEADKVDGLPGTTDPLSLSSKGKNDGIPQTLEVDVSRKRLRRGSNFSLYVKESSNSLSMAKPDNGNVTRRDSSAASNQPLGDIPKAIPPQKQPDSTAEPDDKASLMSHVVFILLLDPKSKFFELIRVTFPPASTTIGDILAMIPRNATEQVLVNQRYSGLVRPRPGAKPWTDKTQLASVMTSTNSNQHPSALIVSGEILIAIPYEYATKYVCRLGRQILANERIQSLLDNIDTSQPSSESNENSKKRRLSPGRSGSSTTSRDRPQGLNGDDFIAEGVSESFADNIAPFPPTTTTMNSRNADLNQTPPAAKNQETAAQIETLASIAQLAASVRTSSSTGAYAMPNTLQTSFSKDPPNVVSPSDESAWTMPHGASSSSSVASSRAGSKMSRQQRSPVDGDDADSSSQGRPHSPLGPMVQRKILELEERFHSSNSSHADGDDDDEGSYPSLETFQTTTENSKNSDSEWQRREAQNGLDTSMEPKTIKRENRSHGLNRDSNSSGSSSLPQRRFLDFENCHNGSNDVTSAGNGSNNPFNRSSANGSRFYHDDNSSRYSKGQSSEHTPIFHQHDHEQPHHVFGGPGRFDDNDSQWSVDMSYSSWSRSVDSSLTHRRLVDARAGSRTTSLLHEPQSSSYSTGRRMKQRRIIRKMRRYLAAGLILVIFLYTFDSSGPVLPHSHSRFAWASWHSQDKIQGPLGFFGLLQFSVALVALIKFQLFLQQSPDAECKCPFIHGCAVYFDNLRRRKRNRHDPS